MGDTLVFCSLSPILYFTSLTDVRDEELNLKHAELQPGERNITKTFSVDFLGGSSNQVVSGHNKGMVYVTDLQTNKYESFAVNPRSKADVNAVTTLDRSSNLILAGSDDTNVRVSYYFDDYLGVFIPFPPIYKTYIGLCPVQKLFK
ncbi:unnamed protein product [Schistosoma mattheei]|uniref:Uncharacterized protein n=1 Tax=Schistosoma mattheei TaxID=31246 RepID=A0A3P8GC88_9TREM|nr:unnamed protein product [Schistosoma mattheei]